jgi:hypothetical protein
LHCLCEDEEVEEEEEEGNVGGCRSLGLEPYWPIELECCRGCLALDLA